MTSPYLMDDLKGDEGLRLAAYPDPLSGGDPWTIGYGHTGPEVHQGLVWTEDQCADALAKDIARACRLLDLNAPWWRDMNDDRQDVLASMVFNMGWSGVLQFHHTLAAMQAGDWQAAHDGMLNSKWARQVGARAQRLAQQMLTGVHAQRS